jgi:Tfp pilus assembly protein PilV
LNNKRFYSKIGVFLQPANSCGSKGQSLIELVIGIGLITVVVGALAIVTVYSLQNTQFSKNQAQATKIAQENLEKVRTIKSANYGVCTQGQLTTDCSSWDDIWATVFGKVSASTCNGCTFNLGTCTVASVSRPFCLNYSATRATLSNGFTSQILLEDEADSQKKITSRVYWNDASGEHSSDLVTIFSRY